MRIKMTLNNSKRFLILFTLVFCCSNQAFAEECCLRVPMQDSIYRAMLELGKEMLGLNDSFFSYRSAIDRPAMNRWAIAHLGIQENELPAPDDLRNKYMHPLQLGVNNNMGWFRGALPDVSPVETLTFMIYGDGYNCNTYDPVVQNFISTIRAAPYVKNEIKRGMRILELGCGPGLFAIWVAKLCELNGIQDVQIVASDRSPIAVINAFDNADLNGVGDKIEFRCGDGLKAVGPDERFDIIVWNELPTNTPSGTIVSRNTGDPGYRTQEAIISGIGNNLKEKTGYFCFVGVGDVWADWIAYWALKYGLKSTQRGNFSHFTENYRLFVNSEKDSTSRYTSAAINFVSQIAWIFEKYFGEQDIFQKLKDGSESKWEGYAPDFRRKIAPIKDLEAALASLDKDSREETFRQIFNAIRQTQGILGIDIWIINHKEIVANLFSNADIRQAFLAIAKSYNRQTGFPSRVIAGQETRDQI